MSSAASVNDEVHSALVAHLLRHSVRRGDFTLKSGAKSAWFIDSKQTVCRPEGLLLMADLALAAIPEDVTAIGGLTVGADPVAYGIAAVGATLGVPAQSISNWVKAELDGKLGAADMQPVSPEQMELARLRAEVARLKMERDILKKAAAYFAKDST